MRTLVATSAFLLAACGGSLEDDSRDDFELSPLGRTPGGAVYHAGHCVPDDERGRLVTFAPGTGLSPDNYREFVGHLGDRTGLCVIAVPYENAQLAAECCTTTDSPSGPQEPGCLVRLLSAKAASAPASMTCTDGSLLSVPPARSVEGAIREALRHLAMSAYLSDDGSGVRWDRVVLTGHSQGAQISMFIALTRHRAAGVGSVAGGVLGIEGERAYPEFVYEARVTDPAVFKAFHHLDDYDGIRRDVYDAIGIPPVQNRTTVDSSPACEEYSHLCVIVDGFMPEKGAAPGFLDDWAWLVAPPS